MIKTLKYLFMTLVVAALTSCEKEDVGETATVSLAGEWMVTVDLVDASGNVVMEDPYGMGYVQVITYNTAANIPTEMWISDLGNFWDFTAKVPCDASTQTFGSSSPLTNEAYESNLTVTDGKVTFGGTLSPSGAKADAIEFYITFSDDDPGMKYLMKGYRRTGLNGGAE
ncbi:MAG: hypothetical protein K2G17_02690 [Duncaniella sp.]|nr:hypothetical protein [Duncaniella sp.]MDE6187022.1 hypothetical protein [Duncaniella sp.]